MRVLLALAIGLGLGYGAVQVLSEFQQRPTVTAGLKPVVVTTDAARSFDDKVRVIEKAADDARRSGSATAVEVTFTEQELTSKLAEAAERLSGVAATDTQIHLSGGNVIATSTVNVQGIAVQVGIVATPVVESGRARLVLKEVQTGGVPLPDGLRQQIESQVGQAIDPASLGLPFAVSSVRVADGKVVVSGTARP